MLLWYYALEHFLESLKDSLRRLLSIFFLPVQFLNFLYILLQRIYFIFVSLLSLIPTKMLRIESCFFYLLCKSSLYYKGNNRQQLRVGGPVNKSRCWDKDLNFERVFQELGLTISYYGLHEWWVDTFKNPCRKAFTPLSIQQITKSTTTKRTLFKILFK